jgi:RNA polymerase sigma factor (sigma-70 family)
MKKLIEKIKNGDAAACETLVKRYQDMAMAYAHSLTGNRQTAEDVAQEAFIQAFVDIDRLKNPNAFRAWLKRIIFTKWNRHRRQKLPPMVSFEEDQDFVDARLPVDPIEDEERRQQALRLVDALPGKERTVVSLFYLSGYRMKEIGELLSIPISTVKSRLYTARLKLQDQYRDLAARDLEPVHSMLTAQAARTTDPERKERVRTPMTGEFDKSEIGKVAQEHYHLVVSMAEAHGNNSGVEPADLMLAGHLGLIVAIDKYHPSSGHEFEAYATWWIRQAVTREIAFWWMRRAEGKPIRMRPPRDQKKFSERTIEGVKEVVSHYKSLVGDLGRVPSGEEIANEMKVPLEHLSEVLEMAKAKGGQEY